MSRISVFLLILFYIFEEAYSWKCQGDYFYNNEGESLIKRIKFLSRLK